MGKSFEVDQTLLWMSRVPCILFVDKQREVGLRWENDEREQTLHQLLTEMDGFTGNMGVSVSGDYLFKKYHELMFVEGKKVENGSGDDDTFDSQVQKLLESIQSNELSNQQNKRVPKCFIHGMFEFGMWEWPKRKKASHVNFTFKSRLWEFDRWEWCKRKKISGVDCKNYEHRKWNFDNWR